jgi:hypothetical protein
MALISLAKAVIKVAYGALLLATPCYKESAQRHAPIGGGQALARPA